MYPALNGTLVAGRLEWREFARMAARTGYPGVDVNLTQAMAMGLEPSKQLLRDGNLTPAVVGLPVEFRKDEKTFVEQLEGLEKAAQFAMALGCPRMSTWVPSWCEVPKDEQRRIWRGRFQRAAAILERNGMRLGLEFLGPLHLRKRSAYEFIYRMDEMLDFAHSCGPNVGLLLDSWHWHHAGATTRDIAAAGKDNIVHVQIADAPDLPPEKILDSERLMPGEGVADLTGFLQALARIGYRDGISPEIFGRGLRDMAPEEGARLGLRTTRAAMQKAGVA